MLAYAEGRQQVQARHMRKAAADTPESYKDWMVWIWVCGTAAVISALILFAYLLP